MPGEGMTINAKSGLGGCIHVFFHGLEIHVAIAINTTGHFHSVTCNSLTEVLIDQVLERVVSQIVIDGCTGTEFEIGIL